MIVPSRLSWPARITERNLENELYGDKSGKGGEGWVSFSLLRARADLSDSLENRWKENGERKGANLLAIQENDRPRSIVTRRIYNSCV